MDEALDIVLSDKLITLTEAIFLLKDHLKNIPHWEQHQIILDLKHVYIPDGSG